MPATPIVYPSEPGLYWVTVRGVGATPPGYNAIVQQFGTTPYLQVRFFPLVPIQPGQPGQQQRPLTVADILAFGPKIEAPAMPA